MEQLINFFTQFGLPITLIALAGIAVLGILKYCKLFKNIEEQNRHYIYLGISVGFSVITTAIYLLIVDSFNMSYIACVSAAIYALNQAFYNIFKITPINKLGVKILDFAKEIWKKVKGKFLKAEKTAEGNREAKE